jgi:metacaspase-1
MNRALIVGISDYGRLNQPLPRCLNDMSGWRDYLVSALDLKPAGVRLLSDSLAIRSAILERLYWLLADAEAGDQRFFVFAGHGACLRRRNPATGALQDQLDETLVAYPDDRDDYEDFMIFERT